MGEQTDWPELWRWPKDVYEIADILGVELPRNVGQNYSSTYLHAMLLWCAVIGRDDVEYV